VFESGGVLRIEGLAGVTARLETGPLGLRDGLAVLNGTVAVACAILAGARPGHVIEGLSRFRPLPHRFELVAESNGIRWIDDSKATNPASVIAALEAAPGPVILVAGGLDKKLSFAGLAAAARGRVRRALLIGQAAAGLAEALEGAVEHEVAGDLATAVERAVRIARPGDCVLLSPACASFDQFRSFEHRGEEFRRLVLEALS
jgi:UDP-N-acetylmuramoylalanine--D-glutamate ligase